jgi:hypothetical protein
MAADDSVEDLFELMIKYWRIKEPQPPNLVISVVGGAKNFKLDGRMRTTFSAGLVKVSLLIDYIEVIDSILLYKSLYCIYLT